MFLLLTRYHYWLDNINATWLYQYVLSNDNFLKINYMFFISKPSQLHPKLSIIFLMFFFSQYHQYQLSLSVQNHASKNAYIHSIYHLAI